MKPLVEPFAIAGSAIRPGARERVQIPVAALYDQTMVSLLIVVVHGSRPGPRLWVSAGIHGDELNGIMSIRRLLQRIEPGELAGTLVAVPSVNTFGLLHQSRYLPDRRDLNRSFPGSPRGSLAARLAHIFMKEIVERCSHGIDLHTAAIHRDNLPQIRANLDDPRIRRMARAFGAPVAIHANIRDGSLRQAATQLGIPTLLYEAGEALRYDAGAVRAAVAGVRRVMVDLGMLATTVPAPRRPPLVSRASSWLRAPKSGFWVSEMDLGERVRKGQDLGNLYTGMHRQFTPKTYKNVRAPLSGVIIGLMRNPLVHVGDALVHIAAVGGR